MSNLIPNILPLDASAVSQVTAAELTVGACLPVPVELVKLLSEIMADRVLSSDQPADEQMRDAYGALQLLDIMAAARVGNAAELVTDDLIRAYRDAADAAEADFS